MDQPQLQRVSQVCETCKTRKKRCDKALPKCGYCNGHNLACKYSISTSTGSQCTTVSSTRKWRAWTPSKTIGRDTLTNGDRETIPTTATTLLGDISHPLEDLHLCDVLWTQVRQILLSLELSLEEIADRFFDGIYTWLPIISLQNLRTTAQDSGNRAPPADFSVLVLAMCLITLRLPPHSSRSSSVCFKSLYMTVKSVFAQVQSLLCASTAIVQAGVLVATYEYACGRVEIAYTSIGLTSRMCHVLGIDEYKSNPSTTPTNPKSLEERNVWWGVIVLERQILLETADRVRYPMTDFPGDDSFLPVQLDNDPSKGVDLTCRIAAVSSTMESGNVGGFGRQAQAARLLDQALSTLKSVDNEDQRVSALKVVDGKLQDLLNITMSEYRGPGSHCGANAIALRTLYLLHESILSQSNTWIGGPGEPAYALNTTSSQAALDTAANMMAEVASDHAQKVTNIDRLPICAGYNFELCIRHFEAAQPSPADDSLSAVADLRTLVDAFRQRWPIYDSLKIPKSSYPYEDSRRRDFCRADFV